VNGTWKDSREGRYERVVKEKRVKKHVNKVTRCVSHGASRRKEGRKRRNKRYSNIWLIHRQDSQCKTTSHTMTPPSFFLTKTHSRVGT
jgi:hypothetical protein